jgi:hypothetical protein
VVPRPDAVGTGKSPRVLALIEQVARLCDQKDAAAKAEDRPGPKRNRSIGAVAATGIPAVHSGLKRHIVARLHAHANAGGGQRIDWSRARQVRIEKARPADAVVDEVGRGMALEEMAIRQDQAGADGPAVVGRVLLVPERVEARDRSRLQIRHRQDIAEIVRTEKRTMGDERADVDSPTLPPHEPVQIEIELWLEDPEHDRAGLDPSADVGQEIVGIAESDGDAEALEIGPQPTPIVG